MLLAAAGVTSGGDTGRRATSGVCDEWRVAGGGESVGLSVAASSEQVRRRVKP